MFGRLTAKRLNAKCDRLSAPITGRASRESQIEAKSRREITRIVAKGKGRGEERERVEADWYFHRGAQSKVCLRG